VHLLPGGQPLFRPRKAPGLPPGLSHYSGGRSDYDAKRQAVNFCVEASTTPRRPTCDRSLPPAGTLRLARTHLQLELAQPRENPAAGRCASPPAARRAPAGRARTARARERRRSRRDYDAAACRCSAAGPAPLHARAAPVPPPRRKRSQRVPAGCQPPSREPHWAQAAIIGPLSPRSATNRALKRKRGPSRRMSDGGDCPAVA
jgi:hypothetical protein